MSRSFLLEYRSWFVSLLNMEFNSGIHEIMAGRFERISDLEWRLFKDIFPQEPERCDRGMPNSPFRYVLNTLLYILITGCRWCDIPRGKIWASKSAKSKTVRCGGSPR